MSQLPQTSPCDCRFAEQILDEHRAGKLQQKTRGVSLGISQTIKKGHTLPSKVWVYAPQGQWTGDEPPRESHWTLALAFCHFLCGFMQWDVSAVAVDSLIVTCLGNEAGSRTKYRKQSVRFGPKEGSLWGKMDYRGKEEGSRLGEPRRETNGIDNQRGRLIIVGSQMGNVWL